MSNKNTSSTDSSNLEYITKHKERKYDTIPFRLEFINKMLEGKNLDSLVYPDGCATEAFVNPYRNDSDDTKSKDTRSMLKKDMKNFYDIIHRIGGKLKYVKSGTTGHTFKGIINLENGNSINYAVKIAAYPKKERYGDMYDVERPENAELMMIRLLSYFVVKKQTPHIVLPIATFNTGIKPFVKLIENDTVDNSNKKYMEFVERYNKGEYYDDVSVLISEWANKGDFLDFLRKNYKDFKKIHWKVFFFQIISVLAVIQSKYPSFRHNDFKANNVLVQKVGKKRTSFSYTVCRNRYVVPSIGLQVKIWDFDFACIPGIVENSKVDADWTTQINVNPERNRYYDLHYFFNTLIKKGFFPQFMTESCVPKEAKEFVNRIIPQKYQTGDSVAKRGRILVDDEYITPNEILKTDPYFEEFRGKKRSSRTRDPKCENSKHVSSKRNKSVKSKNSKDSKTSTRMPKIKNRDIDELRKKTSLRKHKKVFILSSSESYEK